MFFFLCDFSTGIPKRGDGGKDGGDSKDEDQPITTQSPPPAPVVTPGRVPITTPKPPSEPSCALPLVPLTTFNAKTSPFRYGNILYLVNWISLSQANNFQELPMTAVQNTRREEASTGRISISL